MAARGGVESRSRPFPASPEHTVLGDLYLSSLAIDTSRQARRPARPRKCAHFFGPRGERGERGRDSYLQTSARPRHDGGVALALARIAEELPEELDWFLKVGTLLQAKANTRRRTWVPSTASRRYRAIGSEPAGPSWLATPTSLFGWYVGGFTPAARGPSYHGGKPLVRSPIYGAICAGTAVSMGPKDENRLFGPM
jgi:hypothetical protein